MPVMEAETWAAIRRLFEVERLSKSAIAKRLGIHRWTVRRALASPSGPPVDEPRNASRPEKLEPYKIYLAERIKEYPELSGAKLFLEIQKQGYPGGYTILKDYLRGVRPREPEVFLRIETLPGEFAQVDWANVGTVTIGNAKRKVSCFVMVLSFSRMIYLEFTLSQRLEDFLQCHINAFRFFGGVPKKINYDNLKTVVLSRAGRDIRFNPKFMDFAGYYLFEPVPCGVRQAHEKGKVERGIRYVRTAFLAGRPLISLSQHQAESQLWRDEEANVRIHGTTRDRPIDRFEQELSHLTALPARDYDASVLLTVQATRQALVSFETNRYSVPSAFGGKTLTLKATGQTVMILDAAKILATHPRCYEKYRVIENPEHYAGILAERKKAGQAKLVESFLALAPEGSEYLKGLVAQEIHLLSHLSKIQDLVHLYGPSEVAQAIRHALKFNAFGAPYLQNIIHQRRAAQNLPRAQPIVLNKKPEWAAVDVEETDLSIYDDLFAAETPDPEEPPHE